MKTKSIFDFINFIIDHDIIVFRSVYRHRRAHLVYEWYQDAHPAKINSTLNF